MTDATGPRPHVPSLTARELLERLYPAHGNHTVMAKELASTTRTLVLDCSCGYRLNAGTQSFAAAGVTFDDVKQALRNVPEVGS